MAASTSSNVQSAIFEKEKSDFSHVHMCQVGMGYVEIQVKLVLHAK